MAKATGLGGVFLRARSPQALYAWYAQHLGLPPASEGGFVLSTEGQHAPIAFAFFPQDADYFPTSQPAMINFQVDDLDALLDRLVAAGVEVDSRREACDFGKFGWFVDPEGNRVELWQPPEEQASGPS